MRTVFCTAALLFIGCDQAPEPTAIQRGERVFRPVAEKLAHLIVQDMKKESAAAVDKYVKEIGGKGEGDLVLKIATETLAHYAEALSVSSSKETDLKAGKFDDAMNLRKINSAIGTMTTAKMKVPPVCQALLTKYNGGEWKTGLELEFSARVLEGQVLLPKD